MDNPILNSRDYLIKILTKAFKEHDESLSLLTAMVLKRYANGGKYAGNNNRTTNPFG